MNNDITTYILSYTYIRAIPFQYVLFNLSLSRTFLSVDVCAMCVRKRAKKVYNFIPKNKMLVRF